MKGLAKVAMLASALALGGCDTTPQREIDPQIVEGSLNTHKRIARALCQDVNFDLENSDAHRALQDAFHDRTTRAQARVEEQGCTWTPTWQCDFLNHSFAERPYSDPVDTVMGKSWQDNAVNCPPSKK